MANLIAIDEVKGGTAQETAYLSLRRAAMIGALDAGHSITIRGIASSLGMSPTPVREALRRLSTERAFILQENRRISIPVMSKDRFEELLELRVTLETHAAVRALPYVNDRKIEELIQLDDEANKAVAEKNHEMTVISNQKFHATLYMTNPKQLVMPMIESVWLQLGPFLKIAAINATGPVKDHHKAAVQALVSRNAKGLSKAIEQDIRAVTTGPSKLVFKDGSTGK